MGSGDVGRGLADVFLSTFDKQLDSKRRIVVPHEFRAAVGQPFDGVFCFPSIEADCLEGGGKALFDRYVALIEELRGEGRTIIMVEHVMDAIRSLCDRCVVMSSGVKIAEGSVGEALSDPEVVRAYLGDGDA